MAYKRLPRIQLTCQNCGLLFLNSRKTKTICSERCFKARQKKLSGRSSASDGLPTGTVGALTELRISTELMVKSYAVFRALSPSCFCDIIAIKGSEMYKIECRTGYKNPKTGNLSFPSKIHGDIDIFAVHVPNEQKTYYRLPDLKTAIEIP